MNTLTFSDRETVTFTVEKNRFTRFFSKSKTRTFSITAPSIGSLPYLLKYEEFMVNTVPGEHETISEELQWKHAEIVAVAVLRSWSMYPFTIPLFKAYFKWKLSSYKLVMLTRVANRVSKYEDFFTAIDLLHIRKEPKK